VKAAVLCLWDAFSEERAGLQFAVQSLNGLSRTKPVTILDCLIWDSLNLEGQVPGNIHPPETGLPSYTPPHPGTEFPLCRLLRLAGLRWKFSDSHPHGNNTFYINKVQFAACLGSWEYSHVY
jgi:hypothetical protein